jgi:hypothetical protein
LLSAPQLGVRHARRLLGIGRVTRGGRAEYDAGGRRDRRLAVAVTKVSAAVGTLWLSCAARDIDGLLVAGRHISCDPSSHSFLREIPQC